ncbi:acetyl-CoA carboxylase biotin carboxyl carrier protein [Desertibacillus haloalkaliphilus]|uniref:acetyl-CoA carboxylase biotin carboxyl carrier protein n=1 Tax=Desertibacillus haloalkaliphilus TaxID=1328930 RepID=UPI001C262EAE|nr:acetyl-CoA carboxylase biotin carboxyl carrier protein [Desertibacillus haloalkaliphilus]MBU8904990.1 acetyl-CoA carboxylase biotin carboxyl carrier protein [Desertibacillus haloalkaliphilus]
MLKINEIKELIRAVDRSTVGELIIKGESKEQITIRKQGAVTVDQTAAPAPAPVQETQAPAPAPAAPVKEEAPKQEEQQEAKPAANLDDETLHKITSPMVGTFYSAPSPDADPYVKAGDKVSTDSVVCIVEAMKLMNELEAEVNGEIVEVLVENGQLVEYGQPLFLVKQS